MKTINDLLEHAKTLKEDNSDLRPGKDGTNFDLIFNKELMNESIGYDETVLRAIEKSDTFLAKNIRNYQRLYNITMGQTVELFKKEFEKIGNKPLNK